METIRHILGVLADTLDLDRKLEPVREWLQSKEHQRLALAGALIVLTLLALTIYACSGSRPDVARQAWVYDLSTGELHQQWLSDVDEQTIVAHRYACGDDEPFTGYLTRGHADEREIRGVEGEWTTMDSDEGQAILREVIAERCPGELRRVDP